MRPPENSAVHSWENESKKGKRSLGVIMKNSFATTESLKWSQGWPGVPEPQFESTVLVHSFACLCFLYSGSSLRAGSVAYVFSVFTSPSLDPIRGPGTPQNQLWIPLIGGELGGHSISHQDTTQLEGKQGTGVGGPWARAPRCTGLCYGDPQPAPRVMPLRRWGDGHSRHSFIKGHSLGNSEIENLLICFPPIPLTSLRGTTQELDLMVPRLQAVLRKGAAVGPVGKPQKQGPLQGPRLPEIPSQGNTITVTSRSCNASNCVPSRLPPPATPPPPLLHTQSIFHQPPVSLLRELKKKKITIQENTPTHLAHRAWSHSPRVALSLLYNW